MAEYNELVRCIRDCCDENGDSVECDCANCLFKDKIVDITDDDGVVCYTDYTQCVNAMVLAAADAIEELSVGRRGYWKETDMGLGDTAYVCSECGEPWTLIDGTPEDNYMYYCPKCGARMLP